MGNFIQGAKVGGIARTNYHGQYFYIHNINNDVMEMSGISHGGLLLRKGSTYIVQEVVPPSEEHIFYDLLDRFNLKLDLNNGIKVC